MPKTWESIPSALLNQTPHLTCLKLLFPSDWTAIPADFLTHNTQVTKLDLYMNHTKLPGDFLGQFPAL